MTERAIEFCCEEVARQYAYHLRDGYFAVPGMIEAWQNAVLARYPSSISEKDIKRWAKLIEPTKNKDGYRTVGVRVGSSIPPPPEEVPQRMARYIEQLPNMAPEEAYLAFEAIHPFRDGNGRVGKIIFFYLRNEMDKPSHEVVPNPWMIQNP